MKKTLLFLGAAVAVLAAASCGRKDNGNLNAIDLQEYSFQAVGQTVTDSLTGLEGTQVDVTGKGVIPVSIGSNDITALRDSLGKLGNFVIPDRNNVQPAPDPEMTYRKAEPGDSALVSFISNQVSVSLLTPEVIVWRGFYSSYFEGAVHGMFATTFLNYSVRDNKVLSMGDLFKSEAEADLLQLIRERLKDNPGVFAPEEAGMPTVFEITNDGVRFLYGLYEIAPYAAGEISVDFSGYELEDFLTQKGMSLLTE